MYRRMKRSHLFLLPLDTRFMTWQARGGESYPGGALLGSPGGRTLQSCRTNVCGDRQLSFSQSLFMAPPFRRQAQSRECTRRQMVVICHGTPTYNRSFRTVGYHNANSVTWVLRLSRRMLCLVGLAFE